MQAGETPVGEAFLLEVADARRAAPQRFREVLQGLWPVCTLHPARLTSCSEREEDEIDGKSQCR